MGKRGEKRERGRILRWQRGGIVCTSHLKIKISQPLVCVCVCVCHIFKLNQICTVVFVLSTLSWGYGSLTSLVRLPVYSSLEWVDIGWPPLCCSVVLRLHSILECIRVCSLLLCGWPVIPLSTAACLPDPSCMMCVNVMAVCGCKGICCLICNYLVVSVQKETEISQKLNFLSLSQVLQFGRIENGSFILDFQAPFTPIQAFATALANLVWWYRTLIILTDSAWIAQNPTLHSIFLHKLSILMFNIRNLSWFFISFSFLVLSHILLYMFI